MNAVRNQNNLYIRKMDTIYIGYDPREHEAAEVLIHSIRKYASRPFNIVTLNQTALRRAGLYYRAPAMQSTVWGDGEEKYMRDAFDNKPFSTEFSFSRFLVPALNQYEGFALFMDCDFYCRGDIAEIFDTYGYTNKTSPPIRVVRHRQNESVIDNSLKMYGTLQSKYSPKKNWSSAVFWDCGHPSNLNLTVADVSTKPGKWLHEFSWLQDDEIGDMDPKFNWLDSYSSEEINPVCVHFTTGGVIFPDWKPKREFEWKYVNEWKNLREEL